MAWQARGKGGGGKGGQSPPSMPPPPWWCPACGHANAATDLMRRTCYPLPQQSPAAFSVFRDQPKYQQ
eukprot:5237520-Pyramimonas_sp.AAC.1